MTSSALLNLYTAFYFYKNYAGMVYLWCFSLAGWLTILASCL